jgi:large subunit ribosomal protein L4
MELAVTSDNQAKKSDLKITVADQVFATDFNEPLVHQVVTAYLAGARSGTKAQKSRGQVRGGGKKPWKQKGTGSARCGTIRSPLWRGGGVIFAATPRNFSQKVNRKMYRGAMRAILSELIRQDRLHIVDQFTVDQPKTKVLLTKVKHYGFNNKNTCLIITNSADQNLYLAARNISYITACEGKRINPVNLIKHEKIIITKQAIENINETLA